MSAIKKIKLLDGTIHIISLDPESLFEFTSEDNNTNEKYTDVPLLSSSDNNGTILNKISLMFKNIRYLNKLINDINNKISNHGQIDSTHSHTVDQLPVSSVQINSSSNIPTSSLIYKMNEEFTLVKNSFGVKIKMEVLKNPQKDSLIPAKCKNIISIVCIPKSSDGYLTNIYLKNTAEGMRVSWGWQISPPTDYDIIILYTD